MQDIPPVDVHSKRHIQWNCCWNVRDLGGLYTLNGGQTRWRAFVRSDNLGRLNLEGTQALLAYGVKIIIDLRDTQEIVILPPVEIISPPHLITPLFHNIPVIDIDRHKGTGSFDHLGSLTELYVWTLETFKKNIARVISLMANSTEGTIAFYCHSGKDRTGMITAILLDLVEVPRLVIAEDYALSAILLESAGETLLPNFDLTPQQYEKMERFLGSPPEAIQAAMHHLDLTYGGAPWLSLISWGHSTGNTSY
jgi:protein-tyrosine phosphatase